MNWTLIATAVPNLKIIRFIRSNTIKTAVSSYRGKLTHQLCGVSNIKKTERKKKENLIISLRRNDCVIPDKVPWNVTVFVKEVNYWQARTHNGCTFFLKILWFVQFSFANFISTIILLFTVIFNILFLVFHQNFCFYF